MNNDLAVKSDHGKVIQQKGADCHNDNTGPEVSVKKVFYHPIIIIPYMLAVNNA